MDYSFFQHYWWFVISLLGGILAFLLFVQGGQTLIHQVGKTALEQTVLINALGRKWEFTFTTLVTFGGALFAAFPLYYATSFGGAYWLWMLILFCFIIQAVSYEFRSQKGNLYGKRTYETFLLINGIGGIILLGVALGQFFSGGDFVISRANLTHPGNPFITSWTNTWRGLEAVTRPINLLLGLTLFFLARTQAALYFIKNIDNEAIRSRSRHQVLVNAVPFTLLFLGFMFLLLRSSGYTYDPVNEENLSINAFHYAHGLLDMPAVLLMLLTGTGLILGGILFTCFNPTFRKGIWFCGCGTVLAVTAILLLAGWNQSAFFPSRIAASSSLTLANASSSLFTLKVMSIVSLIIPLVILYIFKVWKAINKTPLTEAEMQGHDHSY